MKIYRSLSLALFFMMLLLITNCKKESIKVVPEIELSGISSVTATSAVCNIEITSNGGATVTARGIYWSLDQDPGADDNKIPVSSTSDEFTVSITNLSPGTNYYVKAYATNSVGTALSQRSSFTTPALAPVLSTVTVTDIISSGFKSGGVITSNGGSDVTARGVCWSTNQNPTTADSKTTNGTGNGSFTSDITGLNPGATYYVRAYATNTVGTSYGNQLTATLPAVLPSVTTVDASTVTATTITCGGNVTNDGGGTAIARGVCWSPVSDPTIAGSKTVDGAGAGTYNSNITNLNPGITYYIRAYATNSVGTTYGNQITVTTAAQLAVLTTASITSITSASVTAGGNITANGGALITGRGVCWSTSQNPTTAGNKTTMGSGTGLFSGSITGLSPNTTYYFKAYAINSAGTAYGSEVTATTPASAPVLTTTDASAVGSTTATSGGTVTADGGSPVTERGVCWSVNQNPTTSDSKSNNGTGTGAFGSSITGLTPGTTYYVKAYAINSIGTSYGAQISLTTSAVLPVVSTSTPSSVSAVYATVTGTISSDGGASVTARGICWSTSQNPTITGNKTTDGSGTGSFNSGISNLSPNTTYYFRAYATNSAGTAYGNQVSCTTLASIPVLTTSSVTSIGSQTAISGGDVTNDAGSPVYARGVCWSTISNPTVANSKTSDGSGTGNFVSTITGLLPGTTYYLKAFASNSIGTAYGNMVTFTTRNDLPVLGTLTVSMIMATTVKAACGVTSDGGNTITARGVCWSTSQNPTVSDSKTTDGNGTGNFTSLPSGLNGNTTYYLRAYATNSAGTTYSSQVTFTTSAPDFQDADGNVYHTIKIGSKIWTVENLKVTKYRNGESIANISDGTIWVSATSGAYCNYNNEASNVATYGRLYNFYAVSDSRNIAPEGWHVATKSELDDLMYEYGNGELKEAGTTHWSDPNTGATNSTGFTGLPGGLRGSALFTLLGSTGRWWSSTEKDASNAHNYSLHYNYGGLFTAYNSKFMGFSVRLVKD